MYKDTLTNNLHKIVRQDPLINEINGSIGITLDNFDEQMTDFSNQIDISTATWSLPVYEKELGIVTDITKTDAIRREQIMSRLKGMTKIGAAELKVIADSYAHGDVEITLDHGIVVEFTSVFGVPSNIEDLKAVLRSYAPAHIKMSYKFRYAFYSEFIPYTYSQLSTHTYGELLLGGFL
ncbi:DUF2313 domain-containing protein [Paenibacillus sp. 19GGS1-52]|uniref:putative phage tail protein n=1 Tax=Paenibacillus sp. 19GGS1-52 TaxID=2758563 RepID=UPI001EFBA4C6|nr:putative phage tail protein [Paenibacillus sp. 19GGS1-52]ULO09678.1 DUF2313 domain-containing protein [Paenibacillus sp. 19GGS1-52]